MTNFFAYRLPGETDIHTGASDRLQNGLTAHGFAIASFDGSQIFTIPADTIPPSFPQSRGTTSAISSSRKNHEAGVNHIISSLNRIEEEQGIAGKVVLARQLIIDAEIDPRKAFEALCDKYPHAFIFLFYTEKSGMWIGASPEPLASIEKSILHTVALAGTRPAGSNGEWDVKNQDEQMMVTRYILHKLRLHDLDPIADERCTFQAGPVEHLLTRIHASLPQDLSSQFNLSPQICNLLLDMSPTPALCGYPKNEAMQIIGEAEDFDREYYGGFCGPILSDTDMHLFVNLRSACLFSDKAILFAGGGITQKSKPESEWKETEAKLSTLLSAII